MLAFQEIVLGQSRVGRCKRCRSAGVEALRSEREVVADIESSAGRPGANLSFAGLEPFGHPVLFDLIGVAARAGASRIRLESDAHAMADEPIARRAIAAGVRHLRFPVLSSTADAHDTLVGSRGAFERTAAGVRNFLDAAEEAGVTVHVTAKGPICRHNLHDAAGIVALASQTGARSVLLAIDDVDLNPREAASWIEAACDTGVVYTTWVEVEGIPYGCAQGWELHLSSTYRSVAGDKSAACEACPFASVCAGAIPGASPRVLATFFPPSDAHLIAERVARSYLPMKAG